MIMRKRVDSKILINNITLSLILLYNSHIILNHKKNCLKVKLIIILIGILEIQRD